MGHIITDLKEAFRRGNVYIQLIFINVGVFVVTTLIGILLQLFNRSAAGIFELLALPASFTRFVWQPWSIFTYMFYACRIPAHPVQHALALLVRFAVPVFLLGQTPERSLYCRRNLWRAAVYDLL